MDDKSRPISPSAPMTIMDWASFSGDPARLHSSLSNLDGRIMVDSNVTFDITNSMVMGESEVNGFYTEDSR